MRRHYIAAWKNILILETFLEKHIPERRDFLVNWPHFMKLPGQSFLKKCTKSVKR